MENTCEKRLTFRVNWNKPSPPTPVLEKQLRDAFDFDNSENPNSHLFQCVSRSRSHTFLNEFFENEADVHKVHSTYEEEEMEILFTSRPASKHFFISDLFQLLSSIPSRCNMELRPRITPPHEAFVNCVITESSEMKCRAVYFGNFVQMSDCGLLVHYEVSFRGREQSMSQMNASFVHDQSYLVVRFDNYEETTRRSFLPQRANQMPHANDITLDGFRSSTTRELVSYSLKVFYKQIVRIVVDNVELTDTKQMGVRGLSGCSLAYRKENGPIRIHLVVQNPVLIYRKSGVSKRGRQCEDEGWRYMTINRGRSSDERPGGSILSDCRVFTIELDGEDISKVTLYEILGAIQHRHRIPIQFARMESCSYILSNTSPHSYYFPFSDPNTIDQIRQVMWGSSECWSEERKRAMFPLFYLIECLLSRGCVVKDQICLGALFFWRFFDPVLRCYQKDPVHCQHVLERLIDLVSNININVDLCRTFTYLEHESDDWVNEMEQLLAEQDYVKVRKVLITPTRILFLTAEDMMGNLIIRKFGGSGGNDIIRVSFRDDDNTQMRFSSLGDLMADRVKDILEGGIYVGGLEYSYLGNSNSQLRDHGCYFLRGDDFKTRFLINLLGNFRELDESIPKIVSRIGMYFTQSRCVMLPLPDRWYREDPDPDLIGGNDRNGKPYIFSDGVGRISEFYLRSLMTNLRMGDNVLPSCIQFRFPGAKGVLALDTVLDERQNFARTLGFQVNDLEEGDSVDLCERTGLGAYPNVVFRKSQIKFHSPMTDRSIEMVKYSTPTPVALNRPLINILDQVSEKQSVECHRRMCGRVGNLLDTHIKNCGKALINEQAARNKLKELPHRFDVDRLPVTLGFQLSGEPFFRSLIYAVVKYNMVKQLTKLQIPIPVDRGRTMFGVVDDTGLLQSGQVFVQYSLQCNSNVSKLAATKVHTGPVLITKNPSIVGGDVRVFEALDISELHHLRDVVVFPRHGPRPHPDEMAGSDLDGDEYSVIWDRELFFERNEPPMDFTKKVVEEPERGTTDMKSDIVNFYTKYMKRDQVGMLATGFLINSDLHGIDSKVAQSLAQKHSVAVDFPKTGVPPEPMTKMWTSEIPGGAKAVPPERSNRYPDFMAKDHLPYYTSHRLVGRVYRECRFVQEMLEYAEEKFTQTDVCPDPMIDCPGWETFEIQARNEYHCYVRQLKRELEHYGGSTEAELLTGCLMEPKNRVSDRENDDMSFFNTSTTVKEKVTLLWTNVRKRFFEQRNVTRDNEVLNPFGKYEEVTCLDESPTADEMNPLHRFTLSPTLLMKQKAVAYYKVAYQGASQSANRVLSFPWLVWDVLAQVRRDRFNELPEERAHEVLSGESPFHRTLILRIHDVVHRHQSECFRYINEYVKPYETLLSYCLSNRGLYLVLFVLHRWAERNELFSHALRPTQLVMIVIMCGRGQLPGSEQILSEVTEHSEEHPLDVDLPKLIIAFLLTARGSRFANMDMVDFTDFDIDSVLFVDQLIPLHEAAKRTYLHLVFSGKLDELCLGEETEGKSLVPEIVREINPFTIELPRYVHLSEVQLMLKETCHLVEVKLRKIRNSHGNENRYRVSAMGTMKNLRLLKDILSVDPIQVALATEKDEFMYGESTLARIRESFCLLPAQGPESSNEW